MSHYTIGMRSVTAVQGLADRANRERSAALKQAFGSMGRFISHTVAQAGRRRSAAH